MNILPYFSTVTLPLYEVTSCFSLYYFQLSAVFEKCCNWYKIIQTMAAGITKYDW